MSVIAAVAAPHPPLLIPEVGGAKYDAVLSSARALRAAKERLDSLSPETLVIISPHSPVAGSSFALRTGKRFSGSFARFGHAEIMMDLRGDSDLAAGVVEVCNEQGLATTVIDQGEREEELDWGLLVPYHYLGSDQPVVALSVSDLDYRTHFKFGRAVSDAAARLGRRVCLVASGDLSHRLSKDSPYGYSAAGVEFDRRVVEIFASADLSALMSLEPKMVAQAGECGLRPFICMAGALDDQVIESSVLSYEGPFGVGYLVATLIVEREENV